MKIRISSKNKVFEETLDLEYARKYYASCVENGCNPCLDQISFAYYTRPIRDTLANLNKYNGNHLIFGYVEALYQSENRLPWVTDDDYIEVIS